MLFEVYSGIKSHGQVWVLMQDTSKDESSAVWDADQLSAAQVMLQQLPWEVISELQQDSIRTDICSPIIHFLGQLARQNALPGQQAKDLAQTLMKVRINLLSFPFACAVVSNHCVIACLCCQAFAGSLTDKLCRTAIAAALSAYCSIRRNGTLHGSSEFRSTCVVVICFLCHGAVFQHMCKPSCDQLCRCQILLSS